MACLAMVIIAFLLGFWAGAGWSAAVANKYRKRYEELHHKANHLCDTISEVMTKQQQRRHNSDTIM